MFKKRNVGKKEKNECVHGVGKEAMMREDPFTEALVQFAFILGLKELQQLNTAFTSSSNHSNSLLVVYVLPIPLHIPIIVTVWIAETSEVVKCPAENRNMTICVLFQHSSIPHKTIGSLCSTGKIILKQKMKLQVD